MDSPHLLSLQSEETADIPDELGVEESKEGVTSFLDNSESFVVTRNVPMLSESYDFTPNVELGDFLSRPVKIGTFTWLVSDVVTTSVQMKPWHLFFNDERIKYKLNNYAFLKCNLKLKVVINASPFYYGANLLEYHPLPVFKPSTVVDDSSTRKFISLSQRPHAWIYPQKNAGVEMTLPFFHYQNFLHIQDATEFEDMGHITFNVVAPLRSANGTTGTGVTVQVYAWAEDVCVSGASVGLSLQARDEYETGPVSFIASAVAMATGSLKNIPIIGKYMTATQIGASAVAKIASLFGFCNPPVINDIMPYQPRAFPSLASSEISFPVEKLTLDPKNELSVDPSMVGLPNDDELNIPFLAQKESYLCSSDWTTTSAVDDLLFTSLVQPGLYDASSSVLYMTSLSWIAAMFGAWRGDVIFRFKFICSKYHRGRVRITYDPYGYPGKTIITDPVSTTVAFTEIVDITEDTNVEIRIPFQQAISFLRSGNAYDLSNRVWSNVTSPSIPVYDGSIQNGTITVRVLTGLTAPVATSTIQMLTFVRAADNIEFANPIEFNTLFSNFELQAADEYDDDNELVLRIVAGKPSQPNPTRYLNHFGEVIFSLRQLIHRYVYHETIMQDFLSGDYALIQDRCTRWPRPFGSDPAGVNESRNIAGTANVKFSFTQNIPLTWIAPAFVATKGGINWTYNPYGLPTESKNHMRVYRAPHLGGSSANVSNINIAPSANVDLNVRTVMLNLKSGVSGQALANTKTNAGLNVMLPNFSNWNFQSTDPRNVNQPKSIDGSIRDMCIFECSGSGAENTALKGYRIDKYCAAAPDYSLYFFLNAPVLYLYAALPAAAI